MPLNEKIRPNRIILNGFAMLLWSIVWALFATIGCANPANDPAQPDPVNPESKKSVTVTFYSDTDKTEKYAQELSVGVSGKLTDCRFTRNGHSFEGWVKVGSSALVPNGSAVTLSQDSEYIAQWKITMVKIPGGVFRLFDSLQSPPPMRQTVSGFYVSQCEITQEDYREVVGATPVAFKGKLKPVALSWYHAIAFCNALSIKEGLAPVYTINGSVDPKVWGAIPSAGSRNDATWDAVIADWSKNGYRLPTDMEWRWAALGGQDLPNKEFAGDPNPNATGDDHEPYAWIATYKLGESDPDYGPHQVGTKKPNEFNLYDMTGNLSEWVWDWSTTNGYYLNDETDYRGPVNPGVGTTRFSKLVRGSDWKNDDVKAYSYAVADFPSLVNPNYGFRVARYR